MCDVLGVGAGLTIDHFDLSHASEVARLCNVIVSNANGIADDMLANDDWAVQLVEDDKYQLAIFLNPPTINQIKNIANNQEKMPHKTTYFYPKPVCGLTMYKLC